MKKKENTELLSDAMIFIGGDSPFMDGPHAILEAKEEEFSRMQVRKTEGILWLLGSLMVFAYGLNQTIKSFALAGAHATRVNLCDDYMKGYDNTIVRLNIRESE